MGRKARQREQRKLGNGKVNKQAAKFPKFQVANGLQGIPGVHMGPKGTARWYAPDPAKEESMRKQIATQPKAYQDIYQTFDPFGLYYLEESDNLVTFESAVAGCCPEHMTFRVGVRREFNPHILNERDVMGILPKDLKPVTVERVRDFIRVHELNPPDPKLAKAMEDPAFRKEYYKKMGIACDCGNPDCDAYVHPEEGATA